MEEGILSCVNYNTIIYGNYYILYNCYGSSLSFINCDPHNDDNQKYTAGFPWGGGQMRAALISLAVRLFLFDSKLYG